MSDQNDSRRADHDSPWKMALEAYFEEFLGLLFPVIKWLCKSYRVTFSVIITYVFDRFTELVERTVGCQR